MRGCVGATPLHAAAIQAAYRYVRMVFGHAMRALTGTYVYTHWNACFYLTGVPGFQSRVGGVPPDGLSAASGCMHAPAAGGSSSDSASCMLGTAGHHTTLHRPPSLTPVRTSGSTTYGIGSLHPWRIHSTVVQSGRKDQRATCVCCACVRAAAWRSLARCHPLHAAAMPAAYRYGNPCVARQSRSFASSSPTQPPPFSLDSRVDQTALSRCQRCQNRLEVRPRPCKPRNHRLLALRRRQRKAPSTLQ